MFVWQDWEISKSLTDDELQKATNAPVCGCLQETTETLLCASVFHWQPFLLCCPEAGLDPSTFLRR